MSLLTPQLLHLDMRVIAWSSFTLSLLSAGKYCQKLHGSIARPTLLFHAPSAADSEVGLLERACWAASCQACMSNLSGGLACRPQTLETRTA